MKAIKATEIAELMELIVVSYDTTDEDDQQELYNEFLNSCHECKCETCCTDYAANLKENDPVAYRCGFSDWLDMELREENLFEISDEYFTPDQLEELQEALVDAVNDLF